MIICSCNVLSDDAIRSCLDDDAQCPRTPGQVQRCLGCRAKCGACFPSIRALMGDRTPAAAAESAA